MSNISFTRYVNITSGVVGAGGTRQRELIGRIFTDNSRVSSDDILEFNSANAVGEFFGFDSAEYARAQFYFGWVSPNVTSASRISFSRYALTATAPMIYGADDVVAVSQFVALGDTAELTLVVDQGDTYTVQNIDFSEGVTSYSDIASTVQNAISTQFADVTQLADATVSYDSASGTFIFTGGNVGQGSVSTSSTTLSSYLGWDAGRYVDGTDVLLPAEAIQRSTSNSNNFATVLFLGQLEVEQHVNAARALNSIADVSFIYCVGVSAEDASSWSAAMQNIPGVAMGLVNGRSDYNDMVPMVQIAATNYNNRNATSSFMFREFDLVATVTDDEDADTYDSQRVNYYGQTQSAGRNFAFYQRGVLMGPNTAPVDQNVYANEIWLKDYAGVQFMDLLRGLAEVPANADGIAYGMNTLQAVVEQAIFNGVISVGKELSNAQRASVTRLSGSDEAWRQVENIGYWMDVVINTTVSQAGITEYELAYLLIYAKKDTIRSVEGRHALV